MFAECLGYFLFHKKSSDSIHQKLNTCKNTSSLLLSPSPVPLCKLQNLSGRNGLLRVDSYTLSGSLIPPLFLFFALYHCRAHDTKKRFSHLSVTCYLSLEFCVFPWCLIEFQNIKKTPETRCFQGISFLCNIRLNYLFENCGARRAAFKPYFFLSFILESRVRYPAFFKAGR